jgi:hypothetical protein
LPVELPEECGAVSYPLKVMLFCLAVTMCIIGVSHQFGFSLTN